MDFTPRISPDALRGGPPQSLAEGPQGPLLVATGVVRFDIGIDAATIDAGASKPVIWYAANPYSTTDPGIIVPGPLCAFGIYLREIRTVPANPPALHLYDRCAEVRLVSSPTEDLGNDVATAWIWDAASLNALHPLSTVVGEQSYGLFMSYEGAPVAPRLLVRSGMVTGVTEPGMIVSFTFGLYMLPSAAFGASRVYVPSPWSAPPFMPVGAEIGTHIFYNHATSAVPLGQAANVQRIFRPAAWNTPVIQNGGQPQLMVDARIFGGPWHAHVLGAKQNADPVGGTWDIEEMLRSGILAWPYSPPVVASANNAASIASPRPLDALRVTLNAPENSHPVTEVLLTYPS
jgi:hypothetical protein